MRFVLPALLMVITACGGNDGSNTSTGPLAPVDVAVTRSSNGCLVSHNADAEVNYSLGTAQAKSLLWSCANINTLTRVGVEAFYAFDNSQQCLIERAVRSKLADCTRRATAPATPTTTASIAMRSPPALGQIGGGAYALQPIDTEAISTANLTMFGLSVEVSSNTTHFGSSNPADPEIVLSLGSQSLSGLRYFLPGERQLSNLHPLVTQTTSPGDTYTFVVALKDSLGNIVSSTSFDVTAP